MLQTQVWGVESIKLTISYLQQAKATLPWTSLVPIKILAAMSLVREAGDSLGSAEGEIQVFQHPDRVWHHKDIRERRWQTSQCPWVTGSHLCPSWFKSKASKMWSGQGSRVGLYPMDSSVTGTAQLQTWAVYGWIYGVFIILIALIDLGSKIFFQHLFLFKERARMSQSHASSNWVSVSFVLETEK